MSDPKRHKAPPPHNVKEDITGIIALATVVFVGWKDEVFQGCQQHTEHELQSGDEHRESDNSNHKK